MTGAVAKAEGFLFEETLTGFKWSQYIYTIPPVIP